MRKMKFWEIEDLGKGPGAGAWWRPDSDSGNLGPVSTVLTVKSQQGDRAEEGKALKRTSQVLVKKTERLLTSVYVCLMYIDLLKPI